MFRYLSCINCSTISSGHTATEETSLVKRKILRYLYKQTDKKRCWRGGRSFPFSLQMRRSDSGDYWSTLIPFPLPYFLFFLFYILLFSLPTHHFAPLFAGCKIILQRTNYGLQRRTKILGTVMKNPPSTSLTYQMFRCSIICTSLTPWMPQLALPSPSKQCWDEETLLGQGKVYRGAQTTTLLRGEGERGKN